MTQAPSDRFAQSLATVRTRIADACAAANRPASTVALLAVSKTVAAHRLRLAFECGQQRFGESYAQEALPKIAALRDLPIEWHFIGPIQSNKTAEIARHFHWAHGVDRLKIAQRLSAQRPLDLPPLQVCVQVNVSGEGTKSGCRPDEALMLCKAIAALPGLQLRGFMALPAPAAQGSGPAAGFRLLRQLADDARQNGLPLDTLSMGMSDDLEIAIAEGSTLLRIGSALFGARSAVSS